MYMTIFDHLKGDDLMKKGDNIRLRSDGRYEARYIKNRTTNGKINYGYCYGKTYEEAKEKRDYQLQRLSKPKELNLLILGAGSHGMDVLEIAKSLRVFSKISFLDDDPAKEHVIGKWNDAEKFLDEYPAAIVAVGDEDTRKYWTEKLSLTGFVTPTLIHSSAFISEGVTIGVGTVICARATIASGVRIGNGCIVTSGSTIPRKTIVPNWGYFDFDKIIHYKEEYAINRQNDSIYGENNT